MFFHGSGSQPEHFDSESTQLFLQSESRRYHHHWGSTKPDSGFKETQNERRHAKQKKKSVPEANLGTETRRVGVTNRAKKRGGPEWPSGVRSAALETTLARPSRRKLGRPWLELGREVPGAAADAPCAAPGFKGQVESSHLSVHTEPSPSFFFIHRVPGSPSGI